MLKPHDSPIEKLLRKPYKKVKIEWYEDRLLPRFIVCYGGIHLEELPDSGGRNGFYKIPLRKTRRILKKVMRILISEGLVCKNKKN